MIGKNFQILFYTVLYFVFGGLIMLSITDSSTTYSIALTLALICAVLFIPFYNFIESRVFLWKAETASAVSVKEIEKRLSEFTVNGLTFDYEANNGTYLLTPFEYTMNMVNQSSRVKFYVKICLDETNKKAKFCDYLIEAEREYSLISAYFSAGRARKKGVISLYTTAMSSDGSCFSFSSEAVHDELINLFTKNGWELQVNEW